VYAKKNLGRKNNIFEHETLNSNSAIMYIQAKEVLIVLCLVVLSLCVQIVPAENNLNCYVTETQDVSIVVKKDCHMHTGCQKRFNKKTQQVLEKGCFLTPGYNDTCFDEDANIGVCWCHTDLCNSASRWSSSASLPWFLRILAWTSFTFFVFPGI